ncbi:sulfurtransferase TusA family protein [Parvularcula flava]|uniref:Sulfurtransferase TusA family protein n=1 Tax=Aquisalinus luteolus TaxID=1566827 RepID=A0A8J3ERU8_9PROT|nr:sulfurtransferase TusA family protein [Aquisalinus luteolus]NHK28923.1 sulfurtransferase TusA family protein [Aquisalinus luteolus]GGI00845.1 hypothetical protein GCM10011355_30100 [Aquisalinus luteolus]
MSESRRSDPGSIEILDVRGLRCPMPVIRTESALRKLPAGVDLKVIADDPIARIDIPHFCREAGHSVEELDSEGKTVTFLIRPAE